jgi:hypothetical protein
MISTPALGLSAWSVDRATSAGRYRLANANQDLAGALPLLGVGPRVGIPVALAT